jgi:hypothetical protein
MRFFLLLLLLLFIPQRAFTSEGNDTATFTSTEKIKVTELTFTGPWLHRHGSKEPLSQNQPNPASSYTIIYFYIAKTGPVSLKLYDSRGKFIGYFVDGTGLGGTTYRVSFPVGILSAGEYFYCLMTREFSIAKKMVIVK